MEKLTREGNLEVKRLALEMRHCPKKYPEFHDLMKSLINNNDLYEEWVKGKIEINFKIDESSIPSFEQFANSILIKPEFKEYI